ncbi:hypothetical protein [Hydrogenophaga sp.]|uniref:hypothetical protein n=1 Tax=Hydrogenophaga sp. TaxID=1904254 RepID=UPI003F725CA6
MPAIPEMAAWVTLLAEPLSCPMPALPPGAVGALAARFSAGVLAVLWSPLTCSAFSSHSFL